MPISFKDKVQTLQSLLTCVTIVVGGFWGANEYLEKKKNDRVGKSFEIVKEFRANDDVRRYGEFVESLEVNAILHDKLLKGAEKSERIARLHSAENRNQLKRVIELYENATICVAVAHCDRNVIAAFMASDAHAAYVIGHGVITEWRGLRTDQGYAEELLRVREWYCALSASADHRLKSVSWCKER